MEVATHHPACRPSGGCMAVFTGILRAGRESKYLVSLFLHHLLFNILISSPTFFYNHLLQLPIPSHPTLRFLLLLFIFLSSYSPVCVSQPVLAVGPAVGWDRPNRCDIIRENCCLSQHLSNASTSPASGGTFVSTFPFYTGTLSGCSLHGSCSCCHGWHKS